ncbi:unnamed protein product [Amaranthus hypochondriacus]
MAPGDSLHNPNLPPEPGNLVIQVKSEPVEESITPELIPSSPPSNDPNLLSPSDYSNVNSEVYHLSEKSRSAFSQQMQDPLQPLNSNTGAIVPYSDGETQESPLAVTPPTFRDQKRSSELVRVTNLTIEDERYFRDMIRRTRMFYDALRLYLMLQEEKKSGPGAGRRARMDEKAGKLMRIHGLWLNRDKRVAGSFPGVYIGDVFHYRMELCVIGLHGQTQAGIDFLPSTQSVNGESIATSIVVSGGYEDDEDTGDTLIYTGQGGLDKFYRMSKTQKLEGGNLALERSMHYGMEIRVIRGLKYEGSVTNKVYVYDGLYRVVDCWFDIGKSGFGVYKFRLIRIEGQPEMGSTILRFAQSLRKMPLQVPPAGYLTLDLSKKKENVPVFVFNDIDSDNDPLNHDYLARTIFPPFVYAGGNMGCNCVTSCNDGCSCAIKNGGEIAYDYNGFLLRGKPLVYECGNKCTCPPDCRNRVSQKGLKIRLEIFRSMKTGWGVRTLDLIHAGGFICEYAGIVLTKEQAQVFTMNGDSVVYPGKFTDKWVEWGDLSQMYPQYVKPTYPSIPPLDYALDVSEMRNVACYICHCPNPNVMVQFVMYDHNNVMFPHLMLFAMESIPPMRELSLDYGVPDDYYRKLAIRK